MWNLEEGGHPRSITHAQIQVFVKAVTVGGLDNDVDVRNALSEHLSVVVSTTTMRRALHEVGFGS
jgi:transposase